MYVRNEVPVEALLKGSAAKILLHLLAHRGEYLSNTEIMRGSGIHDRNTFFVAKRQLVEYGLWENPDRFFHTVGEILPTVGIIPHTVVGNTHTPPAVVVPSAQPEVEPSMLTGSQYGEQISWRTEAMQADRMPGGGDAHQRTSEFQARRQRQIEVLQGAWTEMFPKALPLQRDGAKRLLILGEDYAEDVLDAMEAVAARNIASPLGYLSKMLEGRRKEKAAPSVKPTNLGRPTASDDDDGPSADEHYTPDPRYLEQLKKRDALIARGIIKVEDDDDD